MRKAKDASHKFHSFGREITGFRVAVKASCNHEVVGLGSMEEV